MWKFIGIFYLSLCVVSCGNNAAGSKLNDGEEVCYDGVVYVNLSYGQHSWGGAKINKKTLQPELCES